MRVIYRLLIIMALTGMLFLAGFYFLQENQLSQLTFINQTRQSEYGKFFGKILEQENKELRIIVLDYTYWDEMVSFVKTSDPVWAKNILESSLENYQINALWVYDSDLQMTYSISNLPVDAAPEIPFSSKQLFELFQKSPVLNFSFYLEDGTVIEICGTKIVPSNDPSHAGPAQGYFFAGRTWGPERLVRVAEVVDAHLEIIPADQLGKTPASGDIFFIYKPILDSAGAPIAYIRGIFSNTFVQGFIQAQQRDLLVYLILTIAMLVLIASGIGVWIGIPLTRISASLSSGSTDQITSLFRDNSELGRIARLLRDFFDQRIKMADQITLLQKTEDALRSSEQRYRTLTEITSDATFSLAVEPDGTIVPEWGLESLGRISGTDVIDLIIHKKFQSLIHPEDIPMVLSWIAALRQGQSIADEVRIIKPDGETRWIRNQMVPILDENTRQVIRIYGAAQDISRQHTAEDAYRTLVNHSQQGLLVAQDWVIKFVNPAFTRMVGYSQEELLAMGESELDSLIDTETLHPMISKIEDLLDQKTSETVELILHFRHKDQSWRWLKLLCETGDYMGKPAIQATCMDITEHILAETALKDQTDYSNILFSTVNSIVIVLAADGHVNACNPAAKQICACSAQSSEDRYLWDLFHIPEESPLSPSKFAELIKHQTPLDNVEFSIVSQGKTHWLSWSQRYKTDLLGDIVYVVGTAIDITERVFREQQREAIAEIATALRGGTTRHQTILTILEKIHRYSEMDSVGVAFPIAETGDFIIEFVQGSLNKIMEGKRFTVSKSVTGQVMRTGQAYISQDLRSEQNFAMPQLADLIQSAGWIPLISEAKTIGVLLVASKDVINLEILNFLLPIADMAAGAIDRAERFEQAQRRVQQLSALQSINMAIGVSLDLNVTLNVLTAQITTQLGVDAVDVLLLDERTSKLNYAAGNGFRSQAVEKVSLWLGDDQAGRAAMERRSIHIYDPDGIANFFTPKDLFIYEDFVAYDVVPLVVKGHVRGVIETYHRNPYIASREWPLLLEALALETSIAIDNTELLAKLQISNQELQNAFDGTLQGLARMLEIYDYETEKHSLRVVDLTVKLAQYLGVSGDDLTNIRRGAYMHDIGKIGIPREILNKNGRLDPDEWQEIYKHPQYAYDIINPIPFLRPALDIPYGHHERWNGKGYPQQLIGEQIPLAARIFAVVDIFDALTSDRKYRKTLSAQEALDYIRETAGKELDPKIAAAFLDLYPLLKKSPFEAAP